MNPTECTIPDKFAWLNSSKRYLNENQLNGNDNQMNENSFLQVEKFWLDPKNIMSPIKIENVLGYHFVPSDNDELDAFLKKIRPMNIETLSINCRELYHPWNFDWIQKFENLKKLTIIGEHDNGELDHTYLQP